VRTERRILTSGAERVHMDRQQLVALVLVGLMLLSSLAYAFAVI
jgi:hypothetical protein